MGDEPAPGPAPDASRPSWIGATFAQYAAPTVVASLIATGVSVFTAINTAQQNQREYNTKFEQLLVAPEIASAFGGSYVDASAKTAKHDASKESFLQSVREQRATAALLSLQSVADSETQRRTVLLIGARLLNADPGYTGTGGSAARLLTVLIDEADIGRHSLNPWERAKNAGLWETINTQSFRDLVTAGYSNDYYNDDFSDQSMWPYSPTLNGDAPITTDPKYQILRKLTPERYDGWVHLATFAYHFPRDEKPRASSGAPHSSQPRVPPKVAAQFLNEMTDVGVRRNAANIGPVLAQYAIAESDRDFHGSLEFVASDLIATNVQPTTLVMLRHRLLRSRPPVEYIDPDGSFRRGSLGKILGAVPAGSCVTVQETFVPVLVFVPSSLIAPKPSVPAGGATALSGLVHMWAHVRGSSTSEDCLASVNGSRR
jgi:hypothetical protein